MSLYMDLRKFLLCLTLFKQIYSNVYLFQLTPYIFVGDFTCQVIDYSPESTPIAEMAYVYYWTKILDLFDTVILLKYRQCENHIPTTYILGFLYITQEK